MLFKTQQVYLFCQLTARGISSGVQRNSEFGQKTGNLSAAFFLLSLKGQCHEIFAFGFFHESVSPQPQSIPLGPFQIFSKIRGDIRKSRCTTGIDTGGKFTHGVNDTGGKFCHQFR